MCQQRTQAYKTILHLWKLGYSADDIITNVFRVLKTMEMDEMLKLEFIKITSQAHLRIIQGVSSLLQLSALIAKMTTAAISTMS